LNKSRLPLIILVLVAGLTVLVYLTQISGYWSLNSTALSALATSKGTAYPQFFKLPVLERGEDKPCHLTWYLGFIEEQQGNRDKRDRHWVEAVQCDPELVRYLYNRYPQDLALAQTIHRAQPESGSSWFWLGDLKPQQKLDFYIQGLGLEPRDGRRWNKLGVMLRRNGDLTAALQAYLKSCRNGDPGHNGCWNAGKTAEELGDIQSAIVYYRLSRWKPALERLRELETQLENPVAR